MGISPETSGVAKGKMSGGCSFLLTHMLERRNQGLQKGGFFAPLSSKESGLSYFNFNERILEDFLLFLKDLPKSRIQFDFCVFFRVFLWYLNEAG
ncbi:MAG: hypothetical protein ABIL68_12470 [bacterium]